MHKLALVSTALVAITLCGARGQTSEPEPKRPGLSVETKGNFQNIQTIDPDLARQAQNFATLRQIPSAQNAILVPWLIANSLGLPPPFLLETARRLWEMDRRNDAFEWYSLALLRTRYDSGRCADPTAQQIMLPPIAAKVAGGIDQSRPVFGEAGLRALARTDAFSSTASPWWACSQGMAAIKAGLEKQSIEQSAWLKPQSEWDTLRATITQEFTAFFTEQGKPQDDPIPKSKAAYKITAVGTGEYRDFGWLDAKRLVFGEVKRDLKAQSATTVLRLWNDGSAVEEFASFPGRWCAGQGVVTYVVKSENLEGRARRITLAAGEPGRTIETAIEFDGFAMFPQLMHTTTRGGSMSSADPRRLSPFDCRWVRSEVLSDGKKNAEWIPLLPRDGFLSFVKQRGSILTEKILYYIDETSVPVELQVSARGIEPHSLRYYAYKRSYFLSAIEPPPASADERSNCDAAWWFYPQDARTEQICVPVDEVTQNYPTYWPSRAGVLRVIRARRTPHGEKVGGIYLTSSEGKTEKIFEGNVQGANVSPDGCKIAASTSPMVLNLNNAMSRTLMIIDLCSVEPPPSAAAR